MVAKAIKGDTKAAALIIKLMDQLRLDDAEFELAIMTHEQALAELE